MYNQKTFLGKITVADGRFQVAKFLDMQLIEVLRNIWEHV